MNYLASSYETWVVVASVLIAMLASYVALDLIQRIRANRAKAARAWWLGGAIALGTGIWSMHFVGMLAFTLPIPLGYAGSMTFLSWLAAVGVSAIALGVASIGHLNRLRLVVGALSMGAGICAMHYIGMAAIDIAPGIAWNPTLVAASAAIAVVASAVALLIFERLSSNAGRRVTLYKLASAAVMGLAISGMHYTGMSAANFVDGAVCLSANALGGNELGPLVMFASGFLLLLTLLTSTLDSRMQHKTAKLADSLQQANLRLQSANDELQRRAFIDPLTGLSNRLLFDDRLAHATARRDPRGQARLAVLFIDLDGFKPVNDSLGHAAGDAVLKEVATRLQAVAREGDTLARIGGDEFVLLMEDLVDSADALSLAPRLVEETSRPILYRGRKLQISASVGIAVYPDHGEAGQLMSCADAAMYSAKRTGGGSFALFESRMNAGASEQLALQFDLRQALSSGQLSMHYQPKFDGRRSRLRGVEALMRWHHPQRGAISPALFIPLAERIGLINAMGNWALEEVCRQMAAWDDRGVRMSVAVNLSVHQLRQGDLIDRVRTALDRHGLEPGRLLFEITESVAMEDIEATQRAFDGLRDLGVYLSIDDFGTGYSSLSYLRTLPAAQLKIDRSFVKDIEASRDARAVVDAVIKLAHALDLSVVAEGVETEGQRDILLSLDCDELQGYLFARPMAADQLLAWATERAPVQHVAFSSSAFLDEEATLPGTLDQPKAA